jgi:hypothetical protein
MNVTRFRPRGTHRPLPVYLSTRPESGLDRSLGRHGLVNWQPDGEH